MADKSDSSTTAPGSGRVPPVKKRFDLRDFDDEDFETDGGAASGTTTDPILDLLHSMAPSGAAGSAGKREKNTTDDDDDFYRPPTRSSIDGNDTAKHSFYDDLDAQLLGDTGNSVTVGGSAKLSQPIMGDDAPRVIHGRRASTTVDPLSRNSYSSQRSLPSASDASETPYLLRLDALDDKPRTETPAATDVMDILGPPVETFVPSFLQSGANKQRRSRRQKLDEASASSGNLQAPTAAASIVEKDVASIVAQDVASMLAKDVASFVEKDASSRTMEKDVASTTDSEMADLSLKQSETPFEVSDVKALPHGPAVESIVDVLRPTSVPVDAATRPVATISEEATVPNVPIFLPQSLEPVLARLELTMSAKLDQLLTSNPSRNEERDSQLVNKLQTLLGAHLTREMTAILQKQQQEVFREQELIQDGLKAFGDAATIIREEKERHVQWMSETKKSVEERKIQMHTELEKHQRQLDEARQQLQDERHRFERERQQWSEEQKKAQQLFAEQQQVLAQEKSAIEQQRLEVLKAQQTGSLSLDEERIRAKSEMDIIATQKQSLEKECLALKVDTEKARNELFRLQSEAREHQQLKDALHQQEMEVRRVHENVTTERMEVERALAEIERVRADNLRLKKELADREHVLAEDQRKVNVLRLQLANEFQQLGKQKAEFVQEKNDRLLQSTAQSSSINHPMDSHVAHWLQQKENDNATKEPFYVTAAAAPAPKTQEQIDREDLWSRRLQRVVLQERMVLKEQDYFLRQAKMKLLLTPNLDM